MATTTTTQGLIERPFFDDGTNLIELGESGYATPTTSRNVARIGLADRGASIHPAGGGLQEIQLTSGRTRANLGDAEWYAYQRLLTLATSEPGTLGVRDERGHQPSTPYEQRWRDAVCIDARVTINAYEWVSFESSWLAPQSRESTTTTTNGAWPAPVDPATYSGTSTSQDYSAGGVDLGIGGGMELEMVRTADLRVIPRARGVRTTPPWSGAQITFTVQSHVKADSQNLATRMEEIARSIGASPIDLTANGNTYPDVVLERVAPDHTQHPVTAFHARFVKEI